MSVIHTHKIKHHNLLAEFECKDTQHCSLVIQHKMHSENRIHTATSDTDKHFKKSLC